MRRSEKMRGEAIYAGLRCLLAVALAVAVATGGWVAREHRDALWLALAVVGTLFLVWWAAAEALEARRLAALAAEWREDEERRAVRPRV